MQNLLLRRQVFSDLNRLLRPAAPGCLAGRQPLRLGPQLLPRHSGHLMHACRELVVAATAACFFLLLGPQRCHGVFGVALTPGVKSV